MVSYPPWHLYYKDYIVLSGDYQPEEIVFIRPCFIWLDRLDNIASWSCGSNKSLGLQFEEAVVVTVGIR